MADARREIKCLLLPLAGAPLILPNTAIAEIIAHQDISANDDTPDWFLGTTGWRGGEIPLIDFERLCGDRDDAARENSGHFAVLHGIGATHSLGFYGLRIESLPRTETANPERLRPDPDAEASDFIAARARVDSRECAVPDLDALERMVASRGRG